MRKVQFRRGSALLIVLGMLSFVLISAIAFSAYMRYSRLPSSYLRRTSASRLLAKAAMAEAIDCIDTAMGNDLTPGAPINNDQAGVIGGQTTGNLPRYRGEGDDPVYNCWLNRCFIGANDLESVGDTASVLSMEALAYIPPPLINVARYYSRRSPAATWHTMGFDAGRFAFAALDVSDYFDVNRVRCNPSDPDGNAISGRNSSDDGRITLAHIFEKHSKDDAWDAFVDKYVDPEDKTAVPFVSMADLNLAMNKNGFKEWSPFCQFVEGGGQFEDNSHIRELTFITDSYCQVTNRSADAIDLSK